MHDPRKGECAKNPRTSWVRGNANGVGDVRRTWVARAIRFENFENEKRGGRGELQEFRRFDIRRKRVACTAARPTTSPRAERGCEGCKVVHTPLRRRYIAPRRTKSERNELRDVVGRANTFRTTPKFLSTATQRRQRAPEKRRRGTASAISSNNANSSRTRSGFLSIATQR